MHVDVETAVWILVVFVGLGLLVTFRILYVINENLRQGLQYLETLTLKR